MTSSQTTAANFAPSTHSGFIIHSQDVKIQSLRLDGSGNGALSGSLNYHHGITTLFDAQERDELLVPAQRIAQPVESGFRGWIEPKSPGRGGEEHLVYGHHLSSSRQVTSLEGG